MAQKGKDQELHAACDTRLTWFLLIVGGGATQRNCRSLSRDLSAAMSGAHISLVFCEIEMTQTNVLRVGIQKPSVGSRAMPLSHQ